MATIRLRHRESPVGGIDVAMLVIGVLDLIAASLAAWFVPGLRLLGRSGLRVVIELRPDAGRLR